VACVNLLPNTTKLVIGENHEDFHVHTSILCGRSPNILAAIKSRTLNEISWYGRWDLYISYIYAHELALGDELLRKFDFSYLCDLYDIADQINDIYAKNATLKMILRQYQSDSTRSIQIPSACGIGLVYGCTTKGSPARPAMVDIVLARITDHWVEEQWDILSGPFVDDTAKELLRQRGHSPSGHTNIDIEQYMEIEGAPEADEEVKKEA